MLISAFVSVVAGFEGDEEEGEISNSKLSLKPGAVNKKVTVRVNENQQRRKITSHRKCFSFKISVLEREFR